VDPIEDRPAPDADRLRGLAAHLPDLERGMHFGEWRGGNADERGVIQMPWFDFSTAARAFVADLGRCGWVTPFDWPAWAATERGRRLVTDPAAIAGASVEDLGRILTTLVRGDRFSEGTLVNAYETGVLTAIVRRASVLATEVEDASLPDVSTTEEIHR
jgi:hypothetical protein